MDPSHENCTPPLNQTEQWLGRVCDIGPWILAVLLLIVSMPHLARGFSASTGITMLEAWCLAIVFDLAQLVAKISLTRRLSNGSFWICLTIIATCTAFSMTLNTWCFLQQAQGIFGQTMAWATGISIPALVLALCYLGATNSARKSVSPTLGKKLVTSLPGAELLTHRRALAEAGRRMNKQPDSVARSSANGATNVERKSPPTVQMHLQTRKSVRELSYSPEDANFIDIDPTQTIGEY
jgi:hypothetical protein